MPVYDDGLPPSRVNLKAMSEVSIWELDTEPTRKPPVTTVQSTEDDDGPWATLWEIVDAANEPGRGLAALLTGGL